MTWEYQGKEFTENDVGDNWGFVYLITNVKDGTKYIGKKQFYSVTRKIVKGRKNRKVIKKSSDWQTYYGSNDQLKTDLENLGEENFTREILHLCINKTECSYLEAYEQMVRNVLLTDEYYNSWISVRVQKTGLKDYAKNNKSQ